MPFVRKSIIDDVKILSENMREEDIRELKTLGTTPFDSLMQGFRCSDSCYSLCDDKGNIMAMFGVASIPELSEEYGLKAASIWLLGSKDLKSVSRFFIRNSRKVYQKLISNYDFVVNIADARNTLHIKWLKYIGVTFIGECLINGVKFLKFIGISREDE